MADKKSFILYLDMKETVEQLPLEELGKLFLGIFEFVETNEMPKYDNLATNVALSSVCNAIRRDTEKYRNICQKNAERSRKYWDGIKKSKNKPPANSQVV